MNIIKAMIGMSHWKKRMKKLSSKPAYTDEWWAEVADSCEFMPENEREGFVRQFINTMMNF